MRALLLHLYLLGVQLDNRVDAAVRRTGRHLDERGNTAEMVALTVGILAVAAIAVAALKAYVTHQLGQLGGQP